MATINLPAEFLVWPESHDDPQVQRDVLLSVNNDGSAGLLEFGVTVGKTSYYIRIPLNNLERALGYLEGASEED